MKRTAFLVALSLAAIAPLRAPAATIDPNVVGTWRMTNGGTLILSPRGFFLFRPFGSLAYRGTYRARGGRYVFGMGSAPRRTGGTYAAAGGRLVVTAYSGGRYFFTR